MSGDDVSDAALPFRRALSIDIGGAAVLAQRITYVGELGYELYVAREWAVQVWDRLMAAGSSRTGSRPAATACSSRCGSRRATATSAPTSPSSDTPYESGLGFCVDLAKGEFNGRAGARGPAPRRRRSGCAR